MLVSLVLIKSFSIRCEQDQGRLSDEVLTHQFTVNLTRQYIQLIGI